MEGTQSGPVPALPAASHLGYSPKQWSSQHILHLPPFTSSKGIPVTGILGKK